MRVTESLIAHEYKTERTESAPFLFVGGENVTYIRS